MNDFIDIKEYIHIIKSKLLSIIILCMLSIAISGLYSYYVLEPVYEVSTTLIVDTPNTPEDVGNLTKDTIDVTQKLALTYGEIIKSRTVLQQIIDNLNLDISYEKLSKNIVVSIVEGTQIINIKVQDTDKNMAVQIANSIPKVFSIEAKRLVKANGIEVVDEAVVPQKQVKPNPIIIMSVSGIFGAILGVFLAITKVYTNSKIKTIMDIKENIQWPILGIVEKERKRGKNKVKILESYREIRTNIEHDDSFKNSKVILITSIHNKEGKTKLTLNLAKSFSKINKKVLILDCNLQNPYIHKYINIEKDKGVSEILLDKHSIEDCIKKSDINNVDIITSGETQIDSPELLSLTNLRELIEYTKEQYDYVFIDTPAIGETVDTRIIGNYVDSAIFVISSNKVSKDEIISLKEKLKYIDINIIGVIFNKYKVKINKK